MNVIPTYRRRKVDIKWRNRYGGETKKPILGYRNIY
jgi:hypothetical protein